jgi:hypothetical protein
VAVRAARNAALTASGTALGAYIDSMDWDRSIDTAETTTFSTSSNAKTYIVTLQGASLSVSGHWDPASGAVAEVFNNIVSAGTAITWVQYPGGTATGQRSNTFSGNVTNYTETSGVGDDVQWSATIEATGAITVASI